MMLCITLNKDVSLINRAQIDVALQKLNAGQPAAVKPAPDRPQSKKRKIELQAVGRGAHEKGERISVFNRTLLFDIEGINGAEALKDLLAVHNGYIELPVATESRVDKDRYIELNIRQLEKWVKGRSRCGPAPPRTPDLLSIYCKSEELMAILPEFPAATEIVTNKLNIKSGQRSGKEFNAEILLKLGADLQRPFTAQLELRVDKAVEDSSLIWTSDSLAAADRWEQVIGTAFPHGKPNGYTLGPYRSKVYGKPTQARDFYDAATLPEKTHVSIQPAQMTCQLLPFQARTVRWMLQREGFDIVDGSDRVVECEGDLAQPPPLHFKNTNSEGSTCYVSHLLGTISTNLNKSRAEFAAHPKGGILAEEMGLGKSVEILALICLNKRQDAGVEPFLDDFTEQMVKPSSATLIISPSTILQQWQKEVETHAPHLKVYHYIGIQKAIKGKMLPTVDELLGYDIVITTYDVLSKEVHFATPPPDRSLRRRDVPQQKPPRSPLVEIMWWRVCLDEAQMIEGGVSNAANVARLIPRINAWCVTGTPVGKNIEDLYGLLVFLRYEPFPGHKEVWHRLIRNHPASFKALFGRLSLRHTKSDVRGETFLPPQKRFVVTVPFTRVEEENYKFFFQQMLEECEITPEGCAALVDRRAQVIQKMRNWLVRLRQICSHAQVGRANRRAGIAHLRTMEEVLEQMIDKHLTQLRNDERALFSSILKRGQVLEYYGGLDEALECYLEVNRELLAVVLEARQRVEDEEKILAADEDEEEPEESGTNEADDNGEEKNKAGNHSEKNDKGKGKGKAKYEDAEQGAQKDSGYNSDEEDEEWWFEDQTKLMLAKRGLRDILEVEHATLFFLGSIHYQLKIQEEKVSPESSRAAEYAQKEAEYYEAAKLIRKELLNQTEGRAQRLIDQCQQKTQTQSFAEISEIEFPETRGGIETQTISDELQNIQEQLNTQANRLDEFREAMIQILISPLVDQDDDATGEEFEQSVNKQSEGFAYMETLKVMIADREFALTGQSNILAQQDLQRALTRDEPYTVLLKNLIVERNTCKPHVTQPLRALLVRLRSIISTLANAGNHRSEMERTLAEDVLNKAQKILNVQSKANAKLKSEVDLLYRNTINARVEFYRQLQSLSDTVVPFDPEKEKDVTWETTVQWKQVQEAAVMKVADGRAKEKYLTHLKTADDEEGWTCIICQCTFEVGTFTVCGHQYCGECMTAWWKQHKSCPMCKRRLAAADMYQITCKSQTIGIQEEQETTSTTTTNAVHAIYKDIQGSMLKQIKKQNLSNSFGSKIDMICRHLLWIRNNDPGAKSVIFSQWSDVLYVFEQAFNANGIKYATLQKNGVTRFKDDPTVECFLLHAKSQSAGLTLVNATNVFICEPLLNAGLELQAISRVHRIGQTKPTTVWLYVVSGTVEQSVLNLSTKRRLALVGVNTTSPEEPLPALSETKLDEANSEELKQERPMVERALGGGEVVVEEDLIECLLASTRESFNLMAPGDKVRRDLMADAAERRVQVANANGGGARDVILGQAGPAAAAAGAREVILGEAGPAAAAVPARGRGRPRKVKGDV